MKRKFEKLNLFIPWLKKKRKYSFPLRCLRKNLEYEQNTSPEYIGINGRPLTFLTRTNIISEKIEKIGCPNISIADYLKCPIFEQKVQSLSFAHHNSNYRIPFNKNMISNIYISHFLEQLTYKQRRKLLRECYRVIKKRTILRICNTPIEQETNRIRRTINNHKGRDSEPVKELIIVLINPSSPKNFSLYCKSYRFQELKEILEELDPKNVKRFKFRKDNLFLLERIETRNSLIIEGVK